MRVILLMLLAAALLAADTFKLYLKDGDFHSVRDYSIQGDRVHYFSTERGEWEDIPTALVDLSRTERERKASREFISKETKQEEEEDKAEREQRGEIASIPMNPGAYFRVGNKVYSLPAADYQVVTSKRRKALQVLSPLPLIPGKASVVIKGEHSSYTVHEIRPNFYLRLDKEERFGIITLTPKKGQRIVENISILPVANQAQEDRKQMETFEQDLGNSLFKIWPQKDLEAGEYALVEFADKGDANDIDLIIWDFAVR